VVDGVVVDVDAVAHLAIGSANDMGRAHENPMPASMDTSTPIALGLH